MKLFVWVIREILKMLNWYAVRSWRNAKPFSGNAEPQR